MFYEITDMENNVYATYLIPASRLEAMEKAVAKLARKVNNGKTAAEFPPEIEATREVICVWDRGSNQGQYNPAKDYSDRAEFIPYVWTTLKYSRPVLNGWHLVAVYDWEITEDGTRTCYTSVVPGQMVPPEYRETEDTHCDHCHTRRRRNKSMLLTQNFMDFQIVGSTCVKDFLGHATPNSFVDCYSFEQTIERMSDGSYAGGAAIAFIPVKKVLELSAMFVRKYGYIKASDWDNTPTADRVRAWGSNDQYADHSTPEDADLNIAALTEKWVAEQSDASDYMSNLKKAIEAGAISPKRIGIVASAVSVYQKACERAEQENAPVCNEHMGTIKERLKGLTASVERIRFSEGQWGTTTIITLRTQQGHTLVWFATGSLEIERNETWKLDGTVKKHDEFNGMAQTVLTRVKYQLV